MTSVIGNLLDSWMREKALEKAALENRRYIEDQLAIEMGLDSFKEGAITQELEGFKVKTTMRFKRKVDGDKLQEIAAEAGLSNVLGDLFRWKPEINAKQWKAAEKSITDVLSGAITTEPARASFVIEKTDSNSEEK